MKKLWMLLISLTTLIILFGCDSSNDHVPLILYDHTDPYILEFRDHILQNSSDDIIIDVYDAQRSQLIQNEIIGELLLEEPSLMVINPVDRLGVYTIIDEAKKQEVPLIFINREPLETDMNRWDQLYYIGARA
ncbi:substrate-binding domain-containing protein [Mycoplasmatota bacterium]|nr:substrate-binding domain-containing protein [Mycoplasmatota bacterium]